MAAAAVVAAGPWPRHLIARNDAVLSASVLNQLCGGHCFTSFRPFSSFHAGSRCIALLAAAAVAAATNFWKSIFRFFKIKNLIKECVSDESIPQKKFWLLLKLFRTLHYQHLHFFNSIRSCSVCIM